MPVEDLPGYRVDREIGQGAMGRVYVARDLALGREVAVKGLHQDWDDDDEARERLRREARLLARLRHPNIVQVYDLLVVDRELWIVMEYVPGLSLTRCGPWKPEQVVCLVCQLASALAYAHASHIVHLDLKPSNVLISEDGTSRLTDFGVARFLAREAAAGSGTVVYGTPAYLAPERCRGDAAKVDGRADVYSLAVMTYELLLGRLPFEVDPDDPRRTVQAHAQEPVPRPRDLHPDFPQAIERVLLLGLTKDPRARPRARSFRSQMRAAADRVWPGWEGSGLPGARPGRRSRRRSKAADNTADYRTVSMARGGVRPDQSEPALRTRLVADDRMMASAASPSSFLTRRLTELRLPVYRPRRRHGLWGAATALIAVGAFAIGAWLRPAPPPGLPPLAVIGTSVEVDPRDGVGHCPRMTFAFRGRIETNGSGGIIEYQWRTPDGQTSDIVTAQVPPQTKEAAVSMQFTFTGSGPASGVATLHVLRPADVYSAPVTVTYQCP